MIFHCLSCRRGLWAPFPFCGRCQEDLIPGQSSAVDGIPVWPLYTMIGPSHRTLVAWKKQRGLLSDRVIFGPLRAWPALRGRLVAAPLVPIPQAYGRSFFLRGSPAQDLAEALSRITRCHRVDALSVVAGQAGRFLRGAQGRRSHVERWSAAPAITVSRSPGRHAYLVDDFVTTGKTLRDAAQALEASGCSVLGAFAVGLRPKMTGGDHSEGTPS